MPLSPTDFQTDIVRRYFTESCKIFTAYATNTDGIIPSVYFQREFFFGSHFLYVNPLVFEFFFTNKIRDKMLNYRWMLCRQTVFIGELVGKNFTNKVVILHRQNISVGKIVKCCNDLLFWNKFLWHDESKETVATGKACIGTINVKIFTVPPTKSTKIEVSDTHKNQICTKRASWSRYKIYKDVIMLNTTTPFLVSLN
jgi:hypothetical protein